MPFIIPGIDKEPCVCTRSLIEEVLAGLLQTSGQIISDCVSRKVNSNSHDLHGFCQPSPVKKSALVSQLITI